MLCAIRYFIWQPHSYLPFIQNFQPSFPQLMRNHSKFYLTALLGSCPANNWIQLHELRLLGWIPRTEINNTDKHWPGQSLSLKLFFILFFKEGRKQSSQLSDHCWVRSDGQNSRVLEGVQNYPLFIYLSLWSSLTKQSITAITWKMKFVKNVYISWLLLKIIIYAWEALRCHQ